MPRKSAVKSQNKLLALLLTSILLFAQFALPNVAYSADRPLTLSQGTAKWGASGFQAWGVWLAEDFQVPQASALYSIEDINGKTLSTLCSGFNDEKCSGNKSLYQMLRFDICKEISQLSCIANFWAVDSSGKKTSGELVREVLFDPKQAVVENVDLNLTANAALGGIWRLPGIKNASGTENYFISTNATMFKNSNQKAFTFGEINSGIIPVEEFSGKYSIPVLSASGGSSTTGQNLSPDGRDCIVLETTKCQAATAFPEGMRFGITLRMGEKLNGWYHGRLSLPEIKISDWKKGQEISIEAEPVKVSSLDFVAPVSELSEEQKTLFLNCYKGNCGGRGDSSGVSQTGGNLSHPNSMELVTKFANVYQERATKTTSTWTFKNMFNHGGSLDSGAIERCSKGSSTLNGLVMTNALTYSAGPPSFDESTGSLVYKVASPHFDDKGDVAIGTYDLSLRSDIARCLYKFSSAPIKAEVSITAENGEKRIATTIVNEKNGWLYLAARGFTFSSPTIQVKLTQEKAAKPVVTEPVKVTVKKTITCTKGKVTKKVTGTSPKCPIGYKKK